MHAVIEILVSNLEQKCKGMNYHFTAVLIVLFILLAIFGAPNG